MFEVGQIVLVCTWWAPRVPPIGLENPHWPSHSPSVWLGQSQAIRGDSAVPGPWRKVGISTAVLAKIREKQLAFNRPDGWTDGLV